MVPGGIRAAGRCAAAAPGEPSTRRMSPIACTSESSVTTTSPHTRCISASLLTTSGAGPGPAQHAQRLGATRWGGRLRRRVRRARDRACSRRAAAPGQRARRQWVRDAWPNHCTPPRPRFRPDFGPCSGRNRALRRSWKHRAAPALCACALGLERIGVAVAPMRRPWPTHRRHAMRQPVQRRRYSLQP